MKEDNEAIIKKSAVIIILIGISFILVSNADFIKIQYICSLLSAIGCTFIGSGIVNILIDLRDWKEYFSKRLRDVVIKKEYLSSLSIKELINLQREILRINFANNDIGNADSFFDFYSGPLQNLVNKPYRNDARLIINIQKIENEYAYISDCVSYVLCTNGQENGNNVKFCYDKEEQIDLKYDVYIRQLTSDNEIENKVSSTENVIPKTSEKEVIVDIKDYKKYPKILIKCISEYKINIKHFYVWKMHVITNNLSFYINIPDGYDIKVESFALNNNKETIRKLGKQLSLEYWDWVLPQSGISWQIISRSLEDKSSISEIEKL